MRLRHTIRTGIEVGNIPGMVPLLDVVNACNESNYQFFDSWQTLTEPQRAFLTGVYYMNRFIRGHQEDASSDEIAKRQRKAKNAKK